MRFSIIAIAIAIAALGCGDNTTLTVTIDGGGFADAASSDANVPLPDASPVGPDAAGPDGGFQFACTLEDVTPLLECALENCVDLGDIANGGSFPDTTELLICSTTECIVELLTLPADCQQCLLGLAAGGDLDACGLGDLGDLSGGLPTTP